MSFQSDHIHRCVCCRFVWQCMGYAEKECRSKGVFKAVQVNKRGPYCDLCRYGIMFLRHCNAREKRPEAYLPALRKADSSAPADLEL